MSIKHWVGVATRNRGGLHRALGVPDGEKIPAEEIKAAAKKPGKLGKQARLAETLKGLNKK